MFQLCGFYCSQVSDQGRGHVLAWQNCWETGKPQVLNSRLTCTYVASVTRRESVIRTARSVHALAWQNCWETRKPQDLRFRLTCSYARSVMRHEFVIRTVRSVHVLALQTCWETGKPQILNFRLKCSHHRHEAGLCDQDSAQCT